ncbi:MAG: O-antigen ligase family protein [Phycisphaerales bacterium JB037]
MSAPEPSPPTHPDPARETPADAPRPGWRGFLDARWLNRDWAQGAFDLQRRDPVGYRLHLLAGISLCVAASGPISALEFALVGGVLASLVRTTMVWRTGWHLILQPVVLIAIAWGLWQLAQLARSPDTPRGWRELAEVRWILVFVALWPLMEHRRLLIWAWGGGFLLGHATQLVHLIGHLLDFPSLTFGRAPDRITGWWSPVSGATALVAVLGLHLGALLSFARAARTRRWIVLAAALAILTAIGLVLTGTRGAWLAAAALTLVWSFPAAAVLLRPRLGLVGSILAVPAALAIVAVGGWLLARGPIESRLRDARTELTRVFKERDFDSNTGGRLLMWQQATRAFAQHPVLGVGTGGYQHWARADAADQGLPEAITQRRIAAHAHGLWTHAAATHGLAGLALLAALVFTGWWGACRRLPGERPGYERAIPWALAGLVLAASFESIPVVSRASVHLWVLLALSTTWRPRQRERLP